MTANTRPSPRRLASVLLDIKTSRSCCIMLRYSLLLRLCLSLRVQRRQKDSTNFRSGIHPRIPPIRGQENNQNPRWGIETHPERDRRCFLYPRFHIRVHCRRRGLGPVPRSFTRGKTASSPHSYCTTYSLTFLSRTSLLGTTSRVCGLVFQSPTIETKLKPMLKHVDHRSSCLLGITPYSSALYFGGISSS